MLFRSGKNHLFEIEKYCVKETVAVEGEKYQKEI